MFSSSGFFKGVTCPYLASGLCERPYCHYRHSDVGAAKKSSAGEKKTTTIVSALTSINRTSWTETSSASNCADASQTTCRQPPSLLNMMGSAISRVQTRGLAENLVSYKPTPKTATKTVTSTVTVLTNRTKDGIVEYTPTPIHLLKQSKSKVDDVQYDAMVNYSAKMRPLGVTRVTLADVERESVKRSIEDGVDRCVKRVKTEDDCLNVEAKFSEDEESEDDKALKKGVDLQSKTEKNEKTDMSFHAERMCESVVEEKSKDIADNDRQFGNSVSTCSSVLESNAGEGIPAFKRDCSDGHKMPDAVVNSGKPSELLSLQDDNKPIQEEAKKNPDVERKSVSKERQRIHENDAKNKSASKRSKIQPSREESKEKSDKEKNRSSVSNGSKHSVIVSQDNKNSSLQDGSRTSVNHSHHHHKHGSGSHSRSHLKNGKTDAKDSKKHSDSCERESKDHHVHKKQSSKYSRRDESRKERHDNELNRNSSNKIKSSQLIEEKSTNSSCKEDGNSKSPAYKRLSTEDNARSSDVGDEKNKDEIEIRIVQRHRATSQSSSERGHSRPIERENRVGRRSSEETSKTVQAELGNRNGNCSAESFRSGKTEKTSRSIKEKSTTSSTQTRETPSVSSCGKHLVLSSASLQSHEVVSKCSSLTLKSVKRTISHVELFGEDSDTELESPDKGSSRVMNFGIAGVSRRKKSHRSSQDSEDHESDVSFGDAALNDSPEEEFDRFEECHRLFLEDNSRYKRSTSMPVVAKEAKNVQNSVDESSIGKKRVAHGPGTEHEMRRLQTAPKRFQPSAAKTMMDRYRELQKAAEISKNLSNQATPVKNNEATSLADGCISSTASLKVKQRVAHVPKSGDFLQKPILSVDGQSKIPVKVRQLCLEKIFNECVNIYDVADDAKERALSEEKTAHEKSTTKSIYLNLVSNAVKRLRDESPLSKTLSPKNPKSLSHEAILGGSKAANTSFTVNRWGKPPPLPKVFSDSELYKRLLTYVMSEIQLVENSFPRTNTDRRDEVIIKRSERDLQKPQSSDVNQKFCCRCGRAFIILPNGSFTREEECLYHWGHAWKQRVGGTFDNIYSCCGGDLSSRGCQVSKCHVHDDNKYTCLSGYMTTMPSSPRDDGNYGVYALDCEMVYTTFGCELARITIINPKLDLVFDKIVRPDHEVIDYNTRFSGLTADDLKNVTTSLRDVQAVLLHMFNDKTILIGHSLESDLVALKLVHSTVVDTSVVFPHRRGPPFKRALQNVVKETLQKIIQNSITGHDSSEDARSCMELMLWKVKEDAKKSNRYA